MIRPEYVAQLKEVRGDWETWGGSAVRNAGDHIVRYLEKHKRIKSVLDFGCGVGSLGLYVEVQQKHGFLRKDIEWFVYDPSVEGLDKIPERQFDLIVTTDVLEHVEPVSLDETLTWIAAHADQSQFHHIDCNDTRDRLPDGRDIHLIQQPIQWWSAKLMRTKWEIMYRSIIMQRKRGRERYSGTIILDRTSR